jgi:hypothetical protein
VLGMDGFEGIGKESFNPLELYSSSNNFEN